MLSVLVLVAQYTVLVLNLVLHCCGLGLGLEELGLDLGLGLEVYALGLSLGRAVYGLGLEPGLALLVMVSHSWFWQSVAQLSSSRFSSEHEASSWQVYSHNDHVLHETYGYRLNR